MSSPLPLQFPLATLDEDAWDDLLNFIEERRVIPIIGPELLQVETDRGPRLLYEWLAEKLAGKLGVDTSQLPQPYTLNDVVCWFLVVARPARGSLHAAAQHPARRELRAAAGAAPARADHRLRPVRHDDLRSAARAGDQPRALRRRAVDRGHRVRAQPRRRPAGRTRASCSARCIYHLLGRLSASPTYVISDEDTLEFICALQSEHLTPEKLFHELEHNHLLFIGSNFTNWLARLFLRMAKRHRLSDPRDVGEVLADDHSMQRRAADGVPAAGQRAHARLQRRRASSSTSCIARWTTRQQARPRSIAARRAPQRFLPPAREMPENAVFISYAREDLPAVQRLKAGARRRRHRRRGSTSTGSKAATTTTARSSATSRAARFFIPVVSATTQRRLRRLFPPRMELRDRPRAQHRRGRAVHPAGLHRRHERRRGARARQVQGAAHHARCPAASRDARVRCSRLQDSSAARRALMSRRA